MKQDWRKLTDYIKPDTTTIKGLEKWQEIGLDIDGNVNFYHYRPDLKDKTESSLVRLLDRFIGVNWNEQPDDIKEYEEALMKWNTLRTWHLLLKDEAKWYNIIQQSIRGEAPGKYNGFKTISEYYNHIHQCFNALLYANKIELIINDGYVENILIKARIKTKTTTKTIFKTISNVQRELATSYIDINIDWEQLNSCKIVFDETTKIENFIHIRNCLKKMLSDFMKNEITGKSRRNTGRNDFYKKLSVLKKWLSDANLVETRNEAVEFIVKFLDLYWEDQNQLTNYISNHPPKEIITINMEQLVEYQSILFYTKRQK